MVVLKVMGKGVGMGINDGKGSAAWGGEKSAVCVSGDWPGGDVRSSTHGSLMMLVMTVVVSMGVVFKVNVIEVVKVV